MSAIHRMFIGGFYLIS